jgi:cytochrome d ubiquinol oxidase subunit II
MMASIAPIWDGNETWLVLGGLGLFAGFPLAYAIIIPAVYFPILAMLLGLIFRGVAFEFRPTAAKGSKHYWDRSFFWGSLIATFAQGCVLGKFVLGFAVTGRQYAGTSLDWIHPFVLAVGVGRHRLRAARRNLARDEDRRCAASMGTAESAVLPVRRTRVHGNGEHLDAAARAADRGPLVGWPNTLLLSPVPIVTILLAWWMWRALARWRDNQPFFAAMGLFAACYLARHQYVPYIVPHTITLWTRRAPRSPRRSCCSARCSCCRSSSCTPAGLLGVSRKGPVRFRASLNAWRRAGVHERERAAQRLDQ